MTPACTDVRARLEALADGELAPEQAVACREHIVGCAGCRLQYEEASSLPARLAALRAPSPPTELLAAVMRRVGRKPGPLEVWGPIAVEALLVMVAFWYVSGLGGLVALGQRTATDVAAVLVWGAGQSPAPAPAAGDAFLLLLSGLLVGVTLWHLTLLSRHGPRRA